MDGTTRDRTVTKSNGRLLVERAFVMLVGLSIGIPLALGSDPGCLMLRVSSGAISAAAPFQAALR